jgi:hypothetical protein
MKEFERKCNEPGPTEKLIRGLHDTKIDTEFMRKYISL